MIKAITSCMLALACIGFPPTDANAEDVSGLWTLSIKDLSKKEIAKLAVRFSNEPGQSCIAGEWKKLTVEAAKTAKRDFFPISDALTYEGLHLLQ